MVRRPKVPEATSEDADGDADADNERERNGRVDDEPLPMALKIVGKKSRKARKQGDFSLKMNSMIFAGRAKAARGAGPAAPPLLTFAFGREWDKLRARKQFSTAVRSRSGAKDTTPKVEFAWVRKLLRSAFLHLHSLHCTYVFCPGPSLPGRVGPVGKLLHFLGRTCSALGDTPEQAAKILEQMEVEYNVDVHDNQRVRASAPAPAPVPAAPAAKGGKKAGGKKKGAKAAAPPAEPPMLLLPKGGPVSRVEMLETIFLIACVRYPELSASGALHRLLADTVLPRIEKDGLFSAETVLGPSKEQDTGQKEARAAINAVSAAAGRMGGGSGGGMFLSHVFRDTTLSRPSRFYRELYSKDIAGLLQSHQRALTLLFDTVCQQLEDRGHHEMLAAEAAAKKAAEAAAAAAAAEAAAAAAAEADGSGKAKKKKKSGKHGGKGHAKGSGKSGGKKKKHHHKHGVGSGPAKLSRKGKGKRMEVSDWLNALRALSLISPQDGRLESEADARVEADARLCFALSVQVVPDPDTEPCNAETLGYDGFVECLCRFAEHGVELPSSQDLQDAGHAGTARGLLNHLTHLQEETGAVFLGKEADTLVEMAAHGGFERRPSMDWGEQEVELAGGGVARVSDGATRPLAEKLSFLLAVLGERAAVVFEAEPKKKKKKKPS